jgi:SOS-response transcriptional repressor LexA
MSDELSVSSRELEALHHIRIGLVLEGEVPSLRHVMAAMNLHSSRSAYLIYHHLMEKGILKHDADGRWKLVNDPTLSARGIKTVELPIFRTGSFVPAGLSNEYADGVLSVSASLPPCSGRCFLVWAHDDSMTGAGISKGDAALAVRGQTPVNRDLVAAIVNSGLLLRVYWHFGRTATLEPSPAFGPNHVVFARDFRPEGVVRQIVKRGPDAIQWVQRTDPDWSPEMSGREEGREL